MTVPFIDLPGIADRQSAGQEQQAHAVRLQALLKAFREKHGCDAAVLARAPGRVNLIGEHIDYEGYGVLPMAIEQDCLVAAALCADGGLHLACAHPPHAPASSPSSSPSPSPSPSSDPYPDLHYPSDPGQEVDTHNCAWGHYVLAAWKGAHDHLRQAGLPASLLPGARLMVHGVVPQGAGLSSSSALVVSSLLAFLAAAGLIQDQATGRGGEASSSGPASASASAHAAHPTPAQVAELACACERYVGTLGGGMDQAVSVMGREGQAKHVTFGPLVAHDVPLPRGAVVVVANSLTRSTKADTAATRFNLRVVECRLAAMVLARACSSSSGDSSGDSSGSGREGAEGLQGIRTLRQVQARVEACAAATSAGGGADGAGSVQGSGGQYAARALLAAQAGAAALLHQQPYTRPELEQLLGVPLEQLLSDSPAALRVLDAMQQRKVQGQEAGGAAAESSAPAGFMLWQRTQHVYGEAARVLQFRAVCEGSQPAEQQLSALGALMDASHASCDTLYACSCPELNQLVAAAKGAGATGARLTGAGWGGCAVFLLAEGEEEAFVQALKATYYARRVRAGLVSAVEAEGAVFVTRPAAGAGLYKL